MNNPLFSGKYRENALEKIIEMLKNDMRIMAVIVVGSGAKGFSDVFSDIDLCIVIEDDNNYLHNQAIELRRLRENIETKRFRHVDKLSSDFLKEMENTLVQNLTPNNMMNAIKNAVQCLIKETEYMDNYLGRKDVTKLKTIMKKFSICTKIN